MQFSTVALFAAAAVASVVTETDLSSTLVTITSCGPEVTSCPAHVSSSAASNATNITTWEGAANKQYAAGAVALAAGALLAL